VVLDANTLTWKQLGKWSPPVNMTQQDQIIEALKKLGSASIEQLHEETGIPKKSLYEQVSRLVNSEDAGSQLVKEGTKRKYTYRLALFNTIQQLNSVLNSDSSCQQSDRGPIQQNIICSEESVSPEISTTSTVTLEVVENFEKKVPPTKGKSVEYSLETAPYKESYIQHAIQRPQICGITSTTTQAENTSNDVTVEEGQNLEVKTVTQRYRSDPPIQPGDRVYYRGGKTDMARVCGRKKLTTDSVTDGIAVVSHSGWQVTQSIDVTELKLCK
ncbi:MAG: hypothetical protein WBC73_02570, partial [Phormidesmis sp.]